MLRISISQIWRTLTKIKVKWLIIDMKRRDEYKIACIHEYEKVVYVNKRMDMIWNEMGYMGMQVRRWWSTWGHGRRWGYTGTCWCCTSRRRASWTARWCRRRTGPTSTQEHSRRTISSASPPPSSTSTPRGSPPTAAANSDSLLSLSIMKKASTPADAAGRPYYIITII